MIRAALALAALLASAGDEYRSYRVVDDEPVGMFGVSIAALDDCDGDGVADIAVGDASDDSDRGAVFIYSGCTGAFLRELLPSGTGMYFGGCLASVPDVDGDGRCDLVIGSLYHSVRSPSHVWVISTQDFACTSIDVNRRDHFVHVGGLPDSNGDGCGEVTWSDPETVVMRFGGTVAASSLANTRTIVRNALDYSTWDMLLTASYPDVDGDGSRDVLTVQALPVTAPRGARGPQEGSKVLGIEVISGVTGEAVLSCRRTVGDGSPVGLCVLDDQDGDSWPEILVSISGPRPGDKRGDAYLLRGLTFETLRSLSAWNYEDMSKWEREPSLTFEHPTALCAIGDVDRDGHADVAVGYENEFRAFVCSGITGRVLYRIEGPFSHFGSTIVALSDIDGDGVADFGVGTATWMGLIEEAAVFVISGMDGRVIRVLRKPAKFSRG